MIKFTKIKKWAKENGYKVEDAYVYYQGTGAIRVIIDDHNSFKCEEQKSTIYMSIRGQRGSAGGLYLTYERKPSNGKFYSDYGFHKLSQREMIEDMEETIKRHLVQ
jgi:hypothetical protein